MSRKLTPWLIVVAAAAITAVTTTPASADVIIPISPHQHFDGLVNAKTDHAIILTENCHRAPQGTYLIANPVPNQQVKVVLDPTSDGFTGTAAHAINVQIPSPEILNTLVLHDYNMPAAIPVSWPVPCTGPGQVRFTPSPNVGGVPKTIDVTFENVQLPPPPA
jgi:hypothetical protein